MGRVHAQGVGDEGTAVQVVHVQRADDLHVALLQGLDLLQGQLIVGLGQQFAGGTGDHVVGQDLAHQVLGRHDQRLDLGLLQLADVARRDAAAFLDDGLALDLDVERRGLAAQALGDEIQLDLVLAEMDGVGLEEQVQDLLVVVAERAQQHGGRQLAAAVDAHEHAVLGIELEVQPGTAVGDHARGEQELARGMGLALVMVEEHARGAVQLRDDHALGAVHHEGAVLGHERQFAHVDFLLLHFLGAAVLDRRFLVIQGQAHQHAQRRGEGEAAHDAFLHVEGRLAELVLDILEGRVAGIAADREHGLEGRVQADVAALLGSLVLLQELAVGFQLDGQKIRDFEHARALAEVLADAFLLGE